ncbi:MAG: OmpA family protein [Bdellovibrionales bacterium]|jgi:outer membrane protein OmpA-like peptidoglycan-associated protein|nr:OmpA family protein [Bdellovibrionales bacterium]
MTNQTQLLRTGTLIGLLSLTLSACASKIEKADIASSANPQTEIVRLESELKQARTADVDVLATDDYERSLSYLHDAKKGLEKNRSQERIIDDLRYAQAYLDQAETQAEERKLRAPTILESRRAAMQAGADMHPELAKDLRSADKMVRSNAKDLSKLSVERQNEVHARYIELERKAVILTELGNAKAQINAAKNERAKSRAPDSLKRAEVSMNHAEDVISTNVRNPSGYAADAAKAKEDALLLHEVMETIETNHKETGSRLSETSALQLVMQNRKITGLQRELANTQSDTARVRSALNAKEASLNEKQQELVKAESSVALQKAIESARRQFRAEEAEAYQQGDSLLIRLKNIGFKSGQAELPEAALPVLSKVSEVAKELGAAAIRVEGHTDSTGSDKINQELSEKRAEAVATYLKTNGFQEVEAEGMGFSNPLASNKSKAGRAQNRRVDIVIFPAEQTTNPKQSTL